VLKKVTLKFKPMILAVTEEREAIYSTLKGQFEELQAMANDTALPQKMRLRAMGLAVQMAETMEGILKDTAQDRFAVELKDLTEKVEEWQLEQKLRKKGRGKWV
jgi:hypothetical protein